jgi:hypothetical protein
MLIVPFQSGQSDEFEEALRTAIDRMMGEADGQGWGTVSAIGTPSSLRMSRRDRKTI